LKMEVRFAAAGFQDRQGPGVVERSKTVMIAPPGR
jgi:hypothetical protein